MRWVHVVLVAPDGWGVDVTAQSELDTYARVTLRRVQRAIEERGGVATVAQLERMRESYAQLNRDTRRVCARRRKEISDGH